MLAPGPRLVLPSCEWCKTVSLQAWPSNDHVEVCLEALRSTAQALPWLLRGSVVARLLWEGRVAESPWKRGAVNGGAWLTRQVTSWAGCAKCRTAEPSCSSTGNLHKVQKPSITKHSVKHYISGRIDGAFAHPRVRRPAGTHVNVAKCVTSQLAERRWLFTVRPVLRRPAAMTRYPSQCADRHEDRSKCEFRCIGGARLLRGFEEATLSFN